MVYYESDGAIDSAARNLLKTKRDAGATAPWLGLVRSGHTAFLECRGGARCRRCVLIQMCVGRGSAPR